MNPLSILTLPARTAGAVAAAGLRTTSRVVGWAVEQAAAAPRSGPSQPASAVTVPEPRPVALVPDVPAASTAESRRKQAKPVAKKAPAKQAPTKKAPAKEAAAKNVPAKKAAAKNVPAKKAPAKKAAAKKAPSKKAAVLAPALGLSESEVEGRIGDEPLIDSATAKAVAKETDTMRRASDVDKG